MVILVDTYFLSRSGTLVPAHGHAFLVWIEGPALSTQELIDNHNLCLRATPVESHCSSDNRLFALFALNIAKGSYSGFSRANKPVRKCSICGTVREIKYTDDELGDVCDYCEATDKDMWASLKQSRARGRERKRNAMHNIAKRLKILDRVEFPNEGTCLLDGKVYYYAQKKKARVKGQKKYYQMRGFEHFVKVFGQHKR